MTVAFLFQIARIYMVFDIHHDKLYISGIAVEFVLLIFTFIHSDYWAILAAGFIVLRMCILFSVYIWIQCCAKNTYTYLHEEEDIDNILKKFQDFSDDDTKTEQLNEGEKTLHSHEFI